MKSILLCIFLLFSALTMKSQYMVYLKDGRKFQVDDIKRALGGNIKLKTDDDLEKTRFQPEEVDFYTDGEKVNFSVCPDGKECDFYPRLQGGVITVFKYVQLAASAPVPYFKGAVDYYLFYYARKNGVDRFLVSNRLLVEDRAKGEKYLREFVSDDPEVVKKMNDESYKFNVNSTLDLINEYNVRHFSKNQVVDSIKGNVIFYIKSKREPKPPLELVVNDSIAHSLRYASLVPIEIKGSPAKVCVGSSCYLLSFSYKPVYYEIELDKKTGEVRFAETTVVDAMRYIDFIKSR